MTAPDATATARQLLRGMLQKGWQPSEHQPDQCGEYSTLVTPIWDAWHDAERQAAGTGCIAARAAFTAIDRDGRYAYLLSDDAKPLPTSERQYKSQDYVTVLSQLGYSFALNECDDRVEVNDKPLNDVQETVIRTQLHDLGLNYTNKARDAYIAEAEKNSYHPVKRYLEGLAWDGQDHISALVGYFNDRHGTFPLYFRRWAIGAVAKVYEQAQNRMLVLDGPQGIGKGHWVRWLASSLSDYFVESPIDPGNKDHHIRLVRNWIWEVGELGSTTRKVDQDALKYFVTMGWVTVRKPYDRYDMVKLALASFIGTVNNDAGFLNDPTGSRRFMVTTVDRIDWDYTNLDVDQIWAQAYALYRGGEPWQLSPDEAASAREINADYEIDDPLYDLLELHFSIDPNRNDWFRSTVDIRETLNATGWRLAAPRAEAMAIASALKKLGLSKSKCTRNGKEIRGYVGIHNGRADNRTT